MHLSLVNVLNIRCLKENDLSLFHNTNPNIIKRSLKEIEKKGFKRSGFNNYKISIFVYVPNYYMKILHCHRNVLILYHKTMV